MRSEREHDGGLDHSSSARYATLVNLSTVQIRQLRRRTFAAKWELDQSLIAIANSIPSHHFLGNPSGQYPLVYLTRYVRVFAEAQLGTSFDHLRVLDWGCGKGHISKLIRDLKPQELVSCDIAADSGDSSFGQQAPILGRFDISVVPLTHESNLPFPDKCFDVVLSFGVLEHVASDLASLGEISRIIKPGGLFFCFHLPTRFSWTQFVARRGGDDYHDRLYTPGIVRRLLSATHLDILDMWYRSLLPKNRISYPAFRAFERFDQIMTDCTPLRYLATNLEFVCARDG